MKTSSPKPTGIREIAAALGVSIATVDRALHARSGVNPNTRARVLKMAQKLAYQPNIAARNLRLNRRLRIAVHLPREIRSFFDPLRAGIESAANAMLGATVDLDFQTYPRLGQGGMKMLATDLEKHFDGVIVTPGDPDKVAPLLQRLSEQGAAVVCVASDAPRSNRLASVSVDSAVSGAIAAELLSRNIQQSATVAVITGDLRILDHSEKVRGFAATLATLAPHLTLLPVIEEHECPKDAYHATLAVLTRTPRPPSGIYISTANSIPVLEALKEAGLLGKIQLVTTDLFAKLVPFIEGGTVLATLYQRPFTQGKIAFETLASFLTKDIVPEAAVKLAPHIIFRSNLPLFMHHVTASNDRANES